MKKLYTAFGYALHGLQLAMRSEVNLRIHSVVAVAVTIAGLLLNISRFEWLIIILAIGLVFSAELFNTAIEKFCDTYTKEMNDGIKLVKDISAAAVVCSVVAAVVCGMVIFLPYLLALLNN